MYRRTDFAQTTIDDFILPFGGKLSAQNRWVRMAELMPWELVDELYAESFANERTDGRPAYSSRIAFGAIFIKETENLTDVRTVENISENPYMQYFLGLKAFDIKPLFDPSLMVYFRKRFKAEDVAKVNEELYRRMCENDSNNNNSGGANTGNSQGKKTDNKSAKTAPDSTQIELRAEEDTNKNRGKLVIDATCAPSDIRYPQDLSLLNECRENTEKTIDYLWERTERKGHKTAYSRKKARKEYLAVAKQRKPRKNTTRKAIGQQLGYLASNLKTIEDILSKTGVDVLPPRKLKRLFDIQEVYRQQKYMFDNHTHKCEKRIVKLRQPFMRPIVRGKAGKNVEFGQKLEFSIVDGFTFIEKQQWEPYNESTGLIDSIERYRERFGHYPEAVQVDQIYRNKKNRAYCKSKGIRISGPKLGRPSNDKTKVEEDAELAYRDGCERNIVESRNGIVKRRYGLDLIMAYLQETAETEAALNVLAMNMAHCLRRLLRAFLRICISFAKFLLYDRCVEKCALFS